MQIFKNIPKIKFCQKGNMYCDLYTKYMCVVFVCDSHTHT